VPCQHLLPLTLALVRRHSARGGTHGCLQRLQAAVTQLPNTPTHHLAIPSTLVPSLRCQLPCPYRLPVWVRGGTGNQWPFWTWRTGRRRTRRRAQTLPAAQRASATAPTWDHTGKAGLTNADKRAPRLSLSMNIRCTAAGRSPFLCGWNLPVTVIRRLPASSSLAHARFEPGTYPRFQQPDADHRRP